MKNINFKSIGKVVLLFTLLILFAFAIFKALPFIKSLPFLRKEEVKVEPQVTLDKIEPTIDEKIAEIEKKIEENPRDYKLHFELAKLYDQKGLTTLALLQYRTVIDLAPIRAQEAQLSRNWINTKAQQATTSLYEKVSKKYYETAKVTEYVGLTGEVAEIIKGVELKEKRARAYEITPLTPVAKEEKPTTTTPTQPPIFMLMPYTPTPSPIPTPK